MLYLLFFLSGFSALVYEITWARKLSLIFGTDSYGIATILAVFFAGLALGSYLFSRMVTNRERMGTNPTSSRVAGLRGASERMGNPLFLYGILELGIGVYAFLSPLIFELVKTAQAGFWRIIAPSFGSFNLFTFILSVIVLIIPTTLMGGTLPVIVTAAKDIRSNSLSIRTNSANEAGLLYGINTLGAVLGVLLSGFLLIATIGVNETIWFAAGINIFIGAAAINLSKRKNIRSNSSQSDIRSNSFVQDASNTSQHISLNSRLILFSYFLSGFAAIALEVLWTRVLVLTIGGSTYAFSIVLAVFLSGIALGSGAGSWILSRILANYKRIGANERMVVIFGILQLTLGISVMLLLPVLGNLPIIFLTVFKSFGSTFANLQLGLFLLTSLIIFVPTFLMGVAFPVIIKVYSLIRLYSLESEGRIRVDSRSTEGVAYLYAANTIGGVFGALIAGFLLIPAIGTPKSILLMAALYLGIGVLIVFRISSNKIVKVTAPAIAAALILFGFRWTGWEKSLFAAGLYVDPAAYQEVSQKQLVNTLKKSRLLFEKEGVSAYVSVREDATGNISLQINGKTDASTGADMENQILLGQLPMLLHPDPKQVAIVGMGSGITLGSVLSHTIEHVDAIEIEPAVVDAAKYFAEFSNNATADRRVKLVVADGRNFLMSAGNQYDVISSEPSNPWLSGSSKLFTKEYFSLLKNAINKDGVILQWINMYAISSYGLKSVISAYLDVFPEVAAFGIPLSNDLLLLGSNNRLQFDFSQLESRIKSETIATDLAKAAIGESFEILARFYLDKEALQTVTSGIPPNSDNRPYVEFAAPKNLYFGIRDNPWRMLQEHFSPVSSIVTEVDPQTIEKAGQLREASIITRISAIENNVGDGIMAAQKALALDPDDLYLKASLARFYFEEATAHFKSANYSEAASAYEKSASVSATTEAYFNLGASYEEIDPGKAVEAYGKAIAQDSGFTLAYARLGRLLIDAGNLNTALDTYLMLDRLDPSNKDTLVALANLYFVRQDFGRAQEYAKKALKIDPKSEEAKEILQKLP